MYQNNIVILILEIRNEKYIYRLKRNAVKSTDNLANRHYRKKHRPIPQVLRFSENKNRSTIRYDTRCYFNVRSKADISQLNLPHGTDN